MSSNQFSKEQEQLIYRLSRNFRLWIPKEELEEGWYFCRARNFKYGYWNGRVFEYEREKFGMKFQDKEYHWDDGAPYGTVKPLRRVKNVIECSKS